MVFKKLLVQSFAGRFLYYGSVLAVTVFLSRWLEAAEAGRFYYTIVVLSFMQLVVSFSLDAGITYYVSQHGSTTWLKVLIPVWSVLAGLLGMSAIQASVSLLHLPILISPFHVAFFAFLYISGYCFINFCTGWLQAMQTFFWPQFVQAISNLVFLFLCWISLSDTANYEVVYSYYFFSIVAAGLALYVVVLCVKRPSTAGQQASGFSGADLFRYSLTALFANLLFFLVYRLDAWFLKKSPACTMADMGNYLQASKIGQMLLILPQMIAAIVFPQLARSPEDDYWLKTIAAISRMLSVLFLLLFIIVAVIGDMFFPFVFGSSFSEMTVPFLLLIPGLYCLSVHSLLAAWLGGKGLVKANLASAAWALAVSCCVYYFTVEKYGMLAAAATSTLSYSLLLMYSLYATGRRVPIRATDFAGFRLSDWHRLLTSVGKSFSTITQPNSSRANK
jgi:O-antigen/teichoic acid export membrane protein